MRQFLLQKKQFNKFINMKNQLTLLLFVITSSCLSQVYDKAEIKSAIKTNEILVEKVIPNRELAVKYAELILFDIYGKDKIEGEKPYEINLIDDYWIIRGSLLEGYVGGTFEIIFNSKNGQIIKLVHGK